MKLKNFLEAAKQGINKKSIALFPGKFKPPHPGHLYLIQKAAKRVDTVVVIISNREVDGISAEDSKQIFEVYFKADGNVKFLIGETPSPVSDVYQFIENQDLTKYSKLLFLKSTKDKKDVRFRDEALNKALAKNKTGANIKIGELAIQPLVDKEKIISASDIRPLILNKSKENSEKLLAIYNNNKKVVDILSKGRN